VTARERLAVVLAPDVLDALEDLVAERLASIAPAAEQRSPWFALDEAAEYLRVSDRTLERLIRRGRLPSTTVGRRRLVHRDALDALARAAGEE
jgi:excisionase family DNA binding protein